MFDISFGELFVIAVLLLLVMGPERLPEVAKQAAFWIRKARQGVFRLRNEMRNELGGDPFQDLNEARREVNNFKNDMRQMGRDLANAHQVSSDNKEDDQSILEESNAMSEAVSSPDRQNIDVNESEMLPLQSTEKVNKQGADQVAKKVSKKKVNKKKASKKVSSSKKLSKKSSKKATQKNSSSSELRSHE